MISKCDARRWRKDGGSTTGGSLHPLHRSWFAVTSPNVRAKLTTFLLRSGQIGVFYRKIRAQPLKTGHKRSLKRCQYYVQAEQILRLLNALVD